MKKILVYINLKDTRPTRASLEILSHVSRLAKDTGDDVAACLLGSNLQKAIQIVSNYGADRVLVIESERFDRPVNSELIDGLTSVIRHVEPSAVLFASSETVKDILGSLAVRTHAVVLPDVLSFSFGDNQASAVRPVMAAKKLACTEAEGQLVFISVRSGSFDAQENPKEATVESLDDVPGSGEKGAELVEILLSTAETVDLAEARVVVAAGRGVRDQEGKDLVVELASIFNGGIGASRAVVETNLFPATAQIGQTGKVVSPDLYFAVGISGAIQHVAGMSNSRVIVAINKDPDAPIFEVASYGIVGDLYQILPILIDKLKHRANS